MAATPAQMREYVSREMDADLMFIFAEAGVVLQSQFEHATARYNSVRKFSGIDDTRIAVRVALAADLTLDVNAAPPAGALARQELAALVSSWEVAQEQIKKEIDIRAEARALQLTRPISSQEKLAMRRAAETIMGKLPSHEVPSADYLAAKNGRARS